MPFTNTTRYVHALWMLLGQKITDVSEEHVRKSTAKRLGAVGIPARVSVIALRATLTPGRKDGESLVEWSHRWVVNGRWQWRKCGPEHPFAQEYDKGFRVRCYIGFYVKGPSDRPLVVTDRVYDLRR
jgi:hypothetical protein